MYIKKFVESGVGQYRRTDPCGWYFFENGFTDSGINDIKEYGESLDFGDGVLAESANVDYNVRKSRTAWIDINPDTEWIFDRITEMVLEANHEMWGYDLYGCEESIQYAKYFGGIQDSDFYDWHIDCSESQNQRKISVIVQLTDPSEYEGGDVHFKIGPGSTIFPKEKATVFIFPSYCLHKVEPITSGMRESLVLWVSGPPYR